MSDKLQLELDGSEIIAGVKETLSALAELKAAIAGFANNSPTGRVRAEVQALSTTALTVVQSVEKTLGGVQRAVEKSMDEAARSAREGGKKVAKQLSDGMVDGLEGGGKAVSLVRQQVQALQRDYEQAILAGKRFNSLELQGLRAQGVSLTPDHRIQIQALRDSLESQRQVLAHRRRLTSEEQALEAERIAMVSRAAKGVEALRQKSAESMLKQEERDAARTFQMRKRWSQAEAEEIYARQQLLARASKGLAALRQEMEQQAAAATLQALAGTARAQVTAAMAATDRGAYSSIVKGAKFGTLVPSAQEEVAALAATKRAAEDAKAAKNALRNSTQQLAESKRLLARESREVHAAFRGIAGAGGALFLTYGSLVPLTTSFFAASSVREAITAYKDFEYQLKFVQAVAEDTSVSIDNMMRSVSGTAVQGGFSPVEASKGMRILAQAGLSAKEALETLGPVLNVAKVGELGMAEAAMTLTGAMNSFGVGVDNIERIGDVFVKAAAVSNTSVQAISESMKQASTIAQQYRLSVEDIGVAMVALGKRNITGSAAGTAFRNLMDELAAPRGEARKVASILGISLFDPMKHDAKEFFERFVPELRNKLREFDPQSQTFILNRLTNNRGAKALSAILGMTDADLAELKSQLETATGMASRAMINLNDSVQGDLDKLKASLTDSLAKASAAGADPLRTALQQLRGVVSSPEFINAVAGLVNSFTLFVRAAAGAAEILMSPAGLIASSAALVTALTPLGGIITSSAKALLGLASAGTAAAAASTAAQGGALALLGVLGKFALVAGGIVLAGTALGMLYAKLTEKSPSEQAIAHIDNLIRKEREYQLTLDDSITKLRRKLGLESGKTTEESDLDSKIGAARREVERSEAELNRVKGLTAAPGIRTSLVTVQQKAVERAKAQYDELLRLRNGLLIERGYSTAKEAQRRDLERQAAAEEAKRLQEAMGAGTKSFSMPNFKLSGAEYREELREINALISAHQRKAAALDDNARLEEAVLQHRYETGLVSFKNYQSELSRIQRQHEGERLRMLDEESAALREKLKELEAKAKGLNPDSAPAQRLANDIAQVQQRLADAQQRTVKITNEAYLRQLGAIRETVRPANELVQNAERESAALQNNFEQEMRRLRLKENSVLLSEREQFVQEQVLRSTNQMEDQLAKLLAARAELLQKFDFSAPDLPEEAQSAYLRLSLVITDLQRALSGAKATAASIASEAFDAKKINEIARGLNDGFTDALFDGSGKKLRKTLEEELLKKPFRMVVQAFLQPITQGLAGMAYGAIAGGPGSMLSNTAGTVAGNAAWSYLSGGTTSLLGSGTTLGNMFAGASGVGGSFASSVGAGLATDAMGATVAQGTAAATLGSASSIGSTLMTAAPYIAIGAMLLGSFLKKGGGPKADGVFGQINSGIGLGVRTPELAAAAETTARGMQAQFDVLQRQLGGTGAVKFGVGISTDPKGTSPSFLDVTGTRDGRTLFTSLDRNVGRSESDLQAALVKATTEAMFAGLKASQLEKDFQEFFDGIASDADLKIKEAALKTASEVANYTDQIRFLGGAFEQLVGLSVDARGALLDAAGGLSALSQATSSYVQNFYSEEERRRITAQQISRALDSAGLNISYDQVLGATRAQFRGLVDSLDVTTEAGRRSYVALMGVADAFASITSLADDKALLETLTGDLDEAHKALLDARAAETDRIKDGITALESSASRYRSFASDLRRFRDSLLLGDLSPLTPGQRYAESRRIAEETYSRALMGDQAAMDQIESVAQEFLRASQVYNASGSAYLRDFAIVQNYLAVGADKADEAAAWAQAQAEIETAQLSALGTINQSVLTVAQAIENMRTAGAAVLSSGGTVGDAPLKDYLLTLYRGGRYMDGIEALRVTGRTMAQGDALLGFGAGTIEQWARANGVPVFHDGTPYVPSTGLAVLQQGERVTSRGGNDALVAELQALRAEVAALRAEHRQGVVSRNQATIEGARLTVHGVTAGGARQSFERQLAREAVPQ